MIWKIPNPMPVLFVSHFMYNKDLMNKKIHKRIYIEPKVKE